MIIKIEQNKNGSHDNQSIVPELVPCGWAIVPKGIEIPATFPFVNIEVEDNIVTSMTAGTVPTPTAEADSEPTTEERLAALEEAVLAMMEV